MRLVSIAIISSLTAVAACGGGDGDAADAAPRIDMRMNPDSPISGTCLMASTYDRDFDDPPDGTIDVLSLGDETTPIDLDGQLVDVDGDGTPETLAVAIIGVLNTLEPEIPENHGFRFILLDGLGMFTTPNTFDQGPLPAAVELDTGATCGGCMEAWAGWADGAQIDLNTATQAYIKDTGTLTLTMFTPGAVIGANSLVVGTFDNITMTGIDPVSGEPLVPACTTQVTQLGIGFNVTWPAAAVAPSPNAGKHGIDWSRVPRAPITKHRVRR